MRNPCGDFRARLERQLLGRTRPDEMRALEWHEHLLGCGACRELLEAEQALEELLATLPEPKLPADVVQRVLARLRQADEDALDALLALDAGSRPPHELASVVLAGLRPLRAEVHPARAGDGLDRLLEQDEVRPPAGLAAMVLAALAAERGASVPASVPADGPGLDPLLELDRVDLPAGLSQRVRAALAEERAPAPLRLLRWSRATLALAAGFLIAFVLWLGDAPWNATAPGEEDELAFAEAAAGFPELELLEALGVLEDLDLLEEAGTDLDLLLELELGPEDEVLLAFDDDTEGGR